MAILHFYNRFEGMKSRRCPSVSHLKSDRNRRQTFNRIRHPDAIFRLKGLGGLS
jgi:hypothetical protein